MVQLEQAARIKHIISAGLIFCAVYIASVINFTIAFLIVALIIGALLPPQSESGGFSLDTVFYLSLLISFPTALYIGKELRKSRRH